MIHNHVYHTIYRHIARYKCGITIDGGNNALSSTLLDFEWQFLIQMTTRLLYSGTYNDICNTFMQQTRVLIPYQNGVIFQAARESGRIVLSNPFSTENVNDRTDHDFFIKGNYPHWDEFLMLPYSSVFRQSDIITPDKWENTRVYHEVWQPKGLYWGLFISLVHKDVPLAILGIQRNKDASDFTARDVHVMNAMKDPLERKFFSLLEDYRLLGDAGADKIMKTAAGYNLTKREIEIVSLVCAGKGGDEMCQSLFITHATLSKHLSNIYAKTKVKNRTQLFALFQ